jgi:endoglucanase
MKNAILVFLLFLENICVAQKNIFQDGDRVCFVGNSITSNAEFYHNIYQYYVTRFPKRRIEFYNCGISGDVTTGVLKRLNSDVLIHRPTHAVIMIGMNDVNRSLYGTSTTYNQDTLEKRALALKSYKANVELLIERLLDSGVKVFLQKPSIFDQTAQLPRENNLGVNDALKICADILGILADTYHLPVIDYWTAMSKINQQQQLKDPQWTIVGQDRIHPGSTGHFVMMYEFLTTTKADSLVSKIVFSKNKEVSNYKSANCTIEKYNSKSNEFNCIVKEYALPYPITSAANEAITLVPFAQALNQQILQIDVIKKGNYTLWIDSVRIDEFSDADLKEGIQLTKYNNTPQNIQSLAVRQKLIELWAIESNLRTITYVEFKHLQGFDISNGLPAIKQYLENLFTTKLSGTPFYKLQFDKYYQVKPLQKSLLQKLATLQNEVYILAQTKSHTYHIVPKES